jgi:hypothetical protein
MEVRGWSMKVTNLQLVLFWRGAIPVLVLVIAPKGSSSQSKVMLCVVWFYVAVNIALLGKNGLLR